MNIYKSHHPFLFAVLLCLPIFSYATEPLFKALIKPESIGTYELKITVSNDIPQKYYLGSVHFEGINQELTKDISPPNRKYWVISESNKNDFHLRKQGKSLQGKCGRIDWDKSTKNNLAITGNLKDPKYNKYKKNELAYVNCTVRGPINNITPDLTVISKGENKLFHNYSYPMKLPVNTKSFELEVIINNKKYVVTDNLTNELFKVSIQNEVITLLTFTN